MVESTAERTGYVRINIEQHAVGFSVTETLALRIGLACRLASSERVFCAGAVEVVCGGILGVADDPAASRTNHVNSEHCKASTSFNSRSRCWGQGWSR